MTRYALLFSPDEAESAKRRENQKLPRYAWKRLSLSGEQPTFHMRMADTLQVGSATFAQLLRQQPACSEVWESRRPLLGLRTRDRCAVTTPGSKCISL